MNLVQLKYFNAVCMFQSVSAAAEYLHISQPSLSNAIKDLELEFGVTFFQRHHRGMRLTPDGEVLYNMSQDILTRSAEIENVMKNLGKQKKKIRLGIPPMIGSIILPTICRDFSPLHTDVSLDITESGRQDLAQKLSQDYLDLVILPHNEPLDDRLASLPIAKFEIVCCTAKKNALSREAFVTQERLKDAPVILFGNSFFQTEQIKKWFASACIEPNIILQTEQLSTMMSIISSNIAVGFMFRQLIEKNADMVPVSLGSPMYVDVSLVWKKDAHLPAVMNTFKEYITSKKLF